MTQHSMPGPLSVQFRNPRAVEFRPPTPNVYIRFMRMKVFNIIIAVLFAAFAGLQFNDPDPMFWVALYGATAVLFGFAAFEKFNIWIIIAGLVVCAYELFQLLPPFLDWIRSGMPSIAGTMKAETIYVELIREFLGLAICLIALVFLYIQCRRRTARTLREQAME